MCIYTVKNQNLIMNKKFLRGVRDSTECLKIVVSSLKVTAKTNKD